MNPQQDFVEKINTDLLPAPPKYLVPGQQQPRTLLKSDFRIPPNPFAMGAQGQIYRIGFKYADGKLTTSDGKEFKSFAMKKIQKRSLKKSKKELQYFKTELTILYDLIHPNIVRYITHFQDQKNAYIVMELLSGGNLHHKLTVKDKLKSKKSPFEELKLEGKSPQKYGKYLVNFSINCYNRGNYKLQKQQYSFERMRNNTVAELNSLFSIAFTPKANSSSRKFTFNSSKQEKSITDDLNNISVQLPGEKKSQSSKVLLSHSPSVPKFSKYSLSNLPSSKRNSKILEEIPIPVTKSPFSLNESLRIIYDVLDALQFLHSHKIMHRDIKLENILLDKDNRAKLADFGYLCIFNEDSRHTVCGTAAYIAPQILRGSYGFQAEVYSCGVLLLEIITGNVQQGNSFQGHFLSRKSKREKQKLPPIYDQYYPDVSDIVQSMLIDDPKKRIKLQDALNHRVFKRIGKFQKILSDDLMSKSPNRSDIQFQSPKNSVKTMASSSAMSNEDQISHFKATGIEQQKKVSKLISEFDTCITEFSEDEEDMIPDEDKQTNTSIRRNDIELKGYLKSTRLTQVIPNIGDSTNNNNNNDTQQIEILQNEEQQKKEMELSLKSKISGGVKDGLNFLKNKISTPIEGIIKKTFMHKRNNTTNL